MSEKKRLIFHLDMDHFYTAVEEREHPAYKGKPLVVGADPKGGKGRGVVSTSNYEARKVGIRSGMPISRAWSLCPEATYLPPNISLYIKVSEEIMAIAKRYSEKFEQWGIDEAFLDVTSLVRDYAEAEGLARQLKSEIKEKQNLTCSIGIGPNKLLAKMASDSRKPDGLTVVKAEEVATFLAPLPVRKLLWVGGKTEAKLKTIGIKTIGDLTDYDPNALIDKFGAAGAQMYLSARGVDNSEVEQRNEIKSISHETTFEKDEGDVQAVIDALDSLSEAVIEEVTKRHFLFKNVTIKVRYENFETHTHGKTLPFMTDRLWDLRKTTRELLQAYLRSGRKIRLVGVRISSLVSSGKQQRLA